jgi:hypothetical protein
MTRAKKNVVLSDAAAAATLGKPVYGILYSDGSINVSRPDESYSETFESAREDNINQTDPAHLAKVVRLQVTHVKIIAAPLNVPAKAAKKKRSA